MTLLTARTLLLTDRMDWPRPHLRWVSDRFYRSSVTSVFRGGRGN